MFHNITAFGGIAVDIDVLNPVRYGTSSSSHMGYALVAGAGHIHHGKFAGLSASRALSGRNVCRIFQWFMMFIVICEVFTMFMSGSSFLE